MSSAWPSSGEAGFSAWYRHAMMLVLRRRCSRKSVSVPRTSILELSDGRNVMLIERFDRTAQPKGRSRVHMVSALTMLGLDESESRNSSYAAISDRISHVAAIGRAGPDNHLRNHAFLWSEKQRGWALSPLYDVVPKPQIATQRYLHLAIGTQGRLATLDNAASEANRFGLKQFL
jgi:serine/threonine-protein kinase HipA